MNPKPSFEEEKQQLELEILRSRAAIEKKKAKGWEVSYPMGIFIAFVVFGLLAMCSQAGRY